MGKITLAVASKCKTLYFLNLVHRKSVDIAQTYIICLFQVHFHNGYACFLVFESCFSKRYLAKKLDSVAFFLAKNAPKSHLSGDIATILLLVIFPVQAPNFLIPRDSSRIYPHEKPKIWVYVKEIIHSKPEDIVASYGAFAV